MNADNIHHIFHRAAGLWRDRVMTVMMAVIWSERFLSTAVTKLSCEVHYQQSEQELKGLEECSSLFLLLCNSLISLSELTWRNKGDQVVKNKNWIRGVIALLKVEALPLSSKGQVWGYCWDFAACALNLTFVYLLRMWFFSPNFCFPAQSQIKVWIIIFLNSALLLIGQLTLSVYLFEVSTFISILLMSNKIYWM